MPQNRYAGRFAPSPTGDLHFGSLVAAVGSYLQARHRQGAWFIRIEDIDPPREIQGSARSILHELGRLGMEPDGPILYQSDRLQAYEDAWSRLLEKGLAYYCRCSRKMLPENGVYPGTCRAARVLSNEVQRIRFQVAPGVISFADEVMGRCSQDVLDEVGDFVIRRADGLPAYQLAVVVDDGYQRITEVVRGADLLDSTARQIALQSALELPQPDYCHLPLAVLPDGTKLSKRLQSDPVNTLRAADAIDCALRFLGQRPPKGLELDRLWAWAIAHWDTAQIPRQAVLPATMTC